jgi:hypothetical protein
MSGADAALEQLRPETTAGKRRPKNDGRKTTAGKRRPENDGQ